MTFSLVLASCLTGPVAVAAALDDSPKVPVAVTSPDGRVRIEVFVEGQGDSAPLRYRVSLNGRPVILPSRLGIELADGSILGKGSTIKGVKIREFREEYIQFPGKRTKVLDHGNEAVVSLREAAAPNRQWEVVVRAYDDGAAFRYRIPAQEGWDRLEVADDRAEFLLPADADAFAMPMPNFRSPHESPYVHEPVAKLPTAGVIGLPLLAEIPGTGWAAILEADLGDNAAMSLARGRGEGASLEARLAPRLDTPKVAVRASLPHEMPWRGIMIADRPERLIESDFVLNLNDPLALDDISWIKPGKTAFPWWNGFHEDAGKVPFKMGLNTETAKYYIDFCAEAGFPYHSLDGVDNVAWYGGPIVPYQGAGITEGLPGLDLQEVLRYAKSKGVKIRTWMNWRAADKNMETAFPLYREWGIEGVMVDFLDSDDQEIIGFVHRLLKTAAANHLTVTIHNTKETTGLERPYPNLLTTEGVRNLEYNKVDPRGITPEDELTTAFCRMLAGPLDFHQGSFRGVAPGAFRVRNEAPLIVGTPCRTLASYVVFQNHLAMVADYPSAYRGHPALPILVSIPDTWDDTKGLSGKVPESIVVARRNGVDWWVGAMTDSHARAIEVPLGFLGEGAFRAEIHQDDPDATFHMASRTETVRAGDTLTVPIAPAGGALIQLSPVDGPAKAAR